MNPDLPLRDIHLPPEVGLWPLAPGWWVVLCLLLLAVAALVWWWRKRQPLTEPPVRVQVSALRELERIERTYRDQPHVLVRELSVLLRRIAISLYGRRRVAGLTGMTWLQFLDRQSGSLAFSQRFQRALTELPYRPQGEADTAALVQEVRQWLRSQQQDGGAKHV